MSFSSRNSQRGFSLVELMVVVAIIGILAAIAIPSVNKYMAKARQSEAKTNLSSIYTANKAFFSEYGVYDTRFRVIGFTPEGKLRYNVGWAADATTALGTYGYTGTATAGSNAMTYCGALPASGIVSTTTNCGVTPEGNFGIAGSNIGSPTTGFTAGAIGKISQNNTVRDTWTINQAKDLRNTVDGTQ